MKLNFNKLARIMAKSVMLALALSFITAGCGGDDGDDAADAFNNMIRGTMGFNELDNYPEELIRPEALETIAIEMVPAPEEGNNEFGEATEYTCRTMRYEAAPGYSELFLLRPNDDVIWPGSVLRGETIADGRYIPLPGNRKPLRISTSILGVNEVASVEVENPTLGTTRDGRQQLLSLTNTADLEPPANSVFSTNLTADEENLFINLGVNLDAQITTNIQAGLGFNLDFSTSDRQEEFVGRFAHRYFSIDIDLPNNPSDFFENPGDVEFGLSPVYVSSVTYGRHILINLKSRRSQLDVSAALNASLSVEGRLNLDTEFSSMYGEVFETSNVDGTVVGGSGAVCNSITNIENFRDCIADGSPTYQTALPISYTLRFLRDNSVAKVVLRDDYTVRQCDLNPPSNSDPIRWWITEFGNANNKEEGGNGTDEIRGLIYMGLNPARTPRNLGGQPTCRINPRESVILFNRPKYQHVLVPGRNRLGPDKWENVAGAQYTFYNRLYPARIDDPDNRGEKIFDPDQVVEICFNLWEHDGGRDDLYNYALRLTQEEAFRISSECNDPYEIEFTESNRTGGSTFTMRVVRWLDNNQDTVPDQDCRNLIR